MGKIFYIMGKSASGKDKIFGNVLENPDLHLQRLVLYTTRPIRAGETNGKQYHFVNTRDMERLRDMGRIIEERAYNTMHGVWIYFTADSEQLNPRRENYLGIGTLESYQKLKAYYGADLLCPIYIEVNDGLRLQRALKREMKQNPPQYAEMCRRYLADSEDFSEENIQNAGITRRFRNDENIEDCIQEVSTYIQKSIASAI